MNERNLISYTAIFKVLLAVAVVASGCAGPPAETRLIRQAETRAVAFLCREVPAWSKENGCYSCHNNGDAARALYAASLKGYRFAPAILGGTTAWVSQPTTWDHNKGDPGFNDRRLMDVQFASALLAAKVAGRVKSDGALTEAAKRLLRDQAADGSWPIGAGNTLGSPATYGTPLATYVAVKVLKQVNTAEARDAVRRAEEWLQKVPVNNVLNAATIMLSLEGDTSIAAAKRRGECLQFLQLSQTSEGAWGPYADAPPEAFDTAIVLLALNPARDHGAVAKLIRQGRAYLSATQNEDGSWPETTRPPRGESYAQRLSTAGWVTLALLETRDGR
jgi:hypothetical protein